MRRLTLLFASLLPCVTPTFGAETAPPDTQVSPWNQFRGPGGSGVALRCRPPVELDEEHLAWSVPVPPGLSSPVLGGGRVFLTAVEEDRLITLAFDAETGKPLWRKAAPKVAIEEVHDANSPAASTPLVDADRVYVYFGSYGLICYDHDGRELWSKPIETPKTLYGMATSPIAHEDLVILTLDNEANLPDSKLSRSKIIAVKKATGETAWEIARPLYRGGWSTPTIWTHSDGTELVVLGSSRVSAYDPATGEEKWSAGGFSRETIAVPICGKDRVYVSAAMLGGVPDEQPDPEPFWQAVLHFDANGDGKFQKSEITEHFTFPLRPELPPGHPGFGLPVPKDPEGRKRRQAEFFERTDKNHDGEWTRDEFVSSMSFTRAKPTLMAIRPGGKGDISETHVTWRLHRGIPEIPSPILYKNRIYLVCNGGLFTAVDADTGKIVYRKRLGGTGQYSASPIVAGTHLYTASNHGLISVVKPGDEFEIVYQRDLKEPVFVTPAVDSKTIYIRTEKRLHAFRTHVGESVPDSHSTGCE